MKLTKKLEAEILKAYYDVWDAYLRGDMRTFASILDENCYIIGSAAGEVFKNKKAAVKYYKSTSEQITGKAEFRNRKINMMPADKGFMVNEEADFYLLIDDQWTYYGPGRISSLFHKKNNKWKVIHQHGSFPDSKTEEGEQVNTDKIKAENIRLRDAVKRRTEELENKNRELEIETALERVRSVAMAMRKPEDLSGIGEIFFTEFKSLGFTELRNTEIIIISDVKETLTSYYYSDYGVTGIVEVDYKSNPKVQSWVDQLKEANDAFAEVVITENEIKAWRKYREEVGHLPDPKLNKAKAVYYYSYSIGMGGLSISTFKPASKEHIEILERFRNVFNLSYQRYIDIAKAEAQAREAKIEAALEGVRSRSMAMYKSDDLHEVIKVVVEQLSVLSIKFNVSNFAKIDTDGSWDLWLSTPEQTYPALIHVPYIDHPIFSRITEEGTKRNDFFTDVYTREEASIFFHHFFENTIAKNTPEERKQFVYNSKGFTRSIFLTKNIWFSVARYDITPFTEEENAIFKRFAKVFEQAYTRFLDLQKAEAQAREADIELSLERVRAKTMAMQKPSEFVDVINIIGEQFVHLDFDIDWVNFGANGFAISEGIDIWNFAVIPGASPISARVFIPYFDHPVFTTSAATINEFLNGGRDFITVVLDKKTKDIWLDHLFTKTVFKDVPEEYRAIQYAKSGYTTSNISLKDTWLSIGKFDTKIFTDEQHAILRRFANAFGQAYTRFLDLQKAEAQTREAQIEAGLERVRSRAMAMQSSEQLRELIGTVFTELTKLDIVLTRCLIMIYDPKSNDSVWWMANSEAPTQPIGLKVQYHEYPSYLAYVNAWKQKELKWTYTLEGNTKKEWDDFLFVETELSHLPDFVIAGMKAPDRVYLNASFNSFGNLTLATLEPLSDEHFDIMLRFAKVFDLTYTRFNDLKQAEAQAKEARIEAALERVRARSMGMQKSYELAEVVAVLYKQFEELDFGLYQVLVSIYDKKKNVIEWWSRGFGDIELPQRNIIPVIDHPFSNDLFEKWENGVEYYPHILEGELKQSWEEYLFTQTELKNFPQEVKDAMRSFDKVFLSDVFMKYGSLQAAGPSPLPGEKANILKRFVKVLDQAYTRMKDLQNAEAQAREAQIELALERVRARTMAMQKSDELPETSFLLFQQFKELGSVADQLSIGIINEQENVMEISATIDGSKLDFAVNISLQEPIVMKKLVVAWKEQKRSLVLDLSGAELKTYNDYRSSTGKLNFETKEGEHWIIHIAFFSKGILSFSSHEHHPDEIVQLLERFAGVFDLTYTRFLDLKQAEAQGRESQIQLALERVRARTMAMQHSNELSETATLLFDQLKELGDKPERAFIGVINEEERVIEIWATQHGGNKMDMILKATIDEPFVMKRMYNGWKEQKTSIIIDLQGEELESYFQFLKEMGAPVKREIFGERRLENIAFFSKGMLGVITTEPQSSEAIQLYERFANVFDHTYTRFLDLKKAEAQTREAQIELALERVRARTMAMHKSEELSETAQVLFHQLSELGGIPDRISIGIADEANGVVNFWTTDQQGSHLDHSFSARLNERTTIAKTYQAWKEHKKSLVVDLHGEELKEWIQFAREEMGITVKDDQIKDRRVHSLAFFSHGWILATSHDPQSAETIQILERFASVFNLTYRRFLDLQKAEAQAKEAQIESALEKVRSRSLAMHKSDELQEVVNTVFERLTELNIEMDSANIAIFKEGTRDYDYWIASHFQKRAASFHMPYTDLSLTRDLIADRESGKEFSTTAYSFEEKNEWFESAFKNTDFKFLTEGRKQFILNAPAITVAIAFSKNTGVQINRYNSKLPTEGEAEILKRFSKVFEQAYIRFLDLEKAEVQARDAQIEAALERVRSSSLAMHKSEELKDVVKVVFENFRSLGLQNIDSVNINIFHEGSRDFDLWLAAPGQDYTTNFRLPYIDHPIANDFFEAVQKKETIHKAIYDYDLKNKYFEYMFEYSDNKHLPEERKKLILNGRAYSVATGIAKHSSIFIHNYNGEPFSEEANGILVRFSKVFDQAYTRFLDLEKAEAQAREAQIETSLERVRSKTMAMHNSEDVGETVATMFDELVKLGVETVRCGIAIIDESKKMEVWTASTKEDGGVKLIIGQLDMTTHPLFMMVYDAWKNKVPVTTYELIGEDLKDYFRAINNSPNYPTRYDIESLPYRQSNTAFMFPEGSLFVFSQEPLGTETTQIFKRFAGVFGQTYRRYLDLQKAEANAREAQIEAGLERVRARTMAMHSSEDVSMATATMFTELEKLGIENLRGGITIIKPDQMQEVWSITNLPDGRTIRAIGVFDMRIHPLWRKLFKARENKEDYDYYWLAGKDKEDYIAILNATPNYLAQPIKEIPDVHVQSYFFGEGGVWTNSLQPHSEEDKLVMKKFASVFSLTFRRYQDLKKAEAQAREATIEAALEKVRGKAMAMHNSNDLTATASLVFTELRKLGISPMRCGVGILNKESRKALLYSAIASEEGDSLSQIGWVLLDVNPVLKSIYDHWIGGEDYFPVLKKEMLQAYYDHLKSGFEVPDEQKEYEHYGYFLSFSEGVFYGWSEKQFTETEIKILKRFASVIDLTFRRYIELQKSETNAREAVKQAALDRVRAEIASMRTVNDLDRITPLIWNELTILGIPFIRCGVFIMDEEQQLIHTFLSTPDGKAIAAFHLPYDTPGNLAHVVANWKKSKKYIDHWDETEFIQFADILVKEGALVSAEQYLKTIPRGGFYLHFLPFLQGMLYVGNTDQLKEEEIELIQHVADAFSTAYARYEDFNKLESAKQQVEKTLTDLKQAQTQLVQSEKMASLGELTAGIAHEIQNPLNFVNNFSEVSKELLDEMKTELETGNTEDAKDIADDVIQNLEKINHHGKRADAIVKSMLQHSRSSSGKKEPADINGLADEYLRLAYHGLRAKDKSFNAKFETEFDNSIGKINIISQDIGRVLVNLINNAFYAVSERKKQEANGYEPIVSVVTKAVKPPPGGGGLGVIEIKVKDNGNGIPQKVLDKIFQPFFTTKPTGQGTGLGLSLAYDIIKKGHGGELKVETKEGEGSEFIIQLPNQPS